MISIFLYKNTTPEGAEMLNESGENSPLHDAKVANSIEQKGVESVKKLKNHGNRQKNLERPEKSGNFAPL